MRLSLLLVGALGLACRPAPQVAPAAGVPVVVPAREEPARPSSSRPRLVVLLIVDQMRGDYLDRFGPRLRAGLARLRREGAVFTEAHHGHALTFTASGHATLSTGTHPSRHGMIANRYLERSTGRMVEITEDPGVELVGPGVEPPHSPFRIRRDGLADWLLARSPQSKAYALALKGHAAAAVGGHRPSGVLWHDASTGKFVSSSHYLSRLPAWLVEVNAGLDSARRLAEGWERLLPAADGEEPGARPRAPGALGRGLPYTAEELLAMDGHNPHRALRWTPIGDVVSLEVAERLLRGAALGTDDRPDLLVLSLSAADYVGHRYGPDSPEILDTFLRLDGLVERLLATLDEVVGAGRWTLVLTSDHGVMPLPESQEGGRRIGAAEMHGVVNAAVKRAARALKMQPPRPVVSDGVYLLFSGTVSPERRRALRIALAAELRKQAGVEEAHALDELTEGTARGAFADAHLRSLDPERSPDVLVLLAPHHLISDFGGASHGSPYRYDTHVPLIFFGAGVRPGTHSDPVSAVDVAPTLARLLGVAAPADVDGRVLDAALSP